MYRTESAFAVLAEFTSASNTLRVQCREKSIGLRRVWLCPPEIESSSQEFAASLGSPERNVTKRSEKALCLQDELLDSGLVLNLDTSLHLCRNQLPAVDLYRAFKKRLSRAVKRQKGSLLRLRKPHEIARHPYRMIGPSFRNSAPSILTRPAFQVLNPPFFSLLPQQHNNSNITTRELNTLHHDRPFSRYRRHMGAGRQCHPPPSRRQLNQ